LQGCRQQAFGLLIVDVVIKFSTVDIDTHADIACRHGDACRDNQTHANVPQYGKFSKLLQIHTPLIDNHLWNSPHIGKHQRNDCVLVHCPTEPKWIPLQQSYLMNLAKRIGYCFDEAFSDTELFAEDDFSVTG